ncbi:MAG TPA: ABC transporter transmembrane domain-containing protein [Rhodanobacteraceae bacterium]|nr:ABC transporter transmembrane domain-containing protein [Rhodanobacteraceae bacterium]
MSAASENPPKPKSLKPLRALLPYLTPHWRLVGAALSALLIAAAAQLALPIAVRYLIDRGLHDAAVINRYFGLFLVTAVLSGAFAALRFVLVSWLGERVVADIRNAVYSNVIRMDPTFFEVTRTGEVLSRLTADTTLIQAVGGFGISLTLRSALTLLGSLVLLVLTSPRLTLMIVLLIPLVVGPLLLLGRRVRKLSRDSQDRIADSSALAGETINAVQTVQAFNLEGLQTRRFRDAVEHSFAVAVKRIRVRAVLTAVATMLVFGGITFVLWIGAHQVLAGTMTFGQLSQFLLYAGYMGIAAASLSEMWGEVQRGAGAMERLAELLAAEPRIKPAAQPAKLPAQSRGRIEFDDVSFHYPSRPESAALEDFTVAIEPGETVAFVGPSGAGKSTTFQLLLRFYDPGKGRVLIDGVDIARADPEQVRSRIGLVPQDTMLFGASARENIRYGRPDASDAEIEAAARAAEADEFIRALPQGYDTFLGERGLRLSGGQRQRIAIARAILKDPPILLLDEATSSLDAASELLVQQALEKLMLERTTIIIAHRLATVQKADRIVVMEQGRVVASGTHAQLLSASPLYARLAELQFGAAVQPVRPEPEEKSRAALVR